MAGRLTTYIVVAIVGLTLVAGLIVGAQRDENGPVDLIVYNAKVYQGTAASFAEAVAIRGNQILRVGLNREIKRLRRAQTTFVDAHGATVLPGFNDAHVDFVSGGLARKQVDLSGAGTVEEIVERVTAYATAHPDSAWVLGRGWYYSTFPTGLPARELLDGIVKDRPVSLICSDGHTTWVNSKALQLAGIGRRTPNPKSGVIVKDPKTGEPTGVLKEAAQRLIENVLPPVSRDERLEAIAIATAQAHRAGITSIQSASGSSEDFDLFDELRRNGELNVRVYNALSIQPGFTDADADRADAIRKHYPDDPLFKAGGVRMVQDGAIETHMATMLEKYSNKGSTVAPAYSAEELNRIVVMLDARGWQISVQATGDGAVRQALDAYEQAIKRNPAPVSGRRHRIEQIEIASPDDVPRVGTLSVIASMQPLRADHSADQMATWTANIGPDRAAHAWPWDGILDADGHLAFGTDWPAAPLSPLTGISLAVARANPRAEPSGAWLPEQSLALTRAIDAFTSGAAYASFDEHRKGRIARGMLADLVILSADIFSLPPEQLREPTVAVTIFDGKIVYSREREETEH